MKKVNCLCKIVLLFSIMTALFGCASDNHGLKQKTPTVITVWHYYNSAQKIAFDEMVDEFNQTEGLNLGIVVKAYSQSSPSDLSEALVNAAAKNVGAEPMPDVFSTYVDTAQELDQSYGLAVLDDYLSKKELDAYIPAYIEEGRIGSLGELKILPVAKSTEVLMLNATDWEPFAKACNLKTNSLLTWEGLADVASKYYTYTDSLTVVPNDGKAFFARDALANYILIGSKQLGAEIFVPDENGGKAVFNQEVMRKLWENYYIPYIKGHYTKKGRFATDDAKLGDVIALVGSNTGATFFPSEVSEANNSVHPVELAVLPLPNFVETEPMAVQQGAGMAVSKSDELHEYASVVFLKWFTEPKRNLKFAAESAYLPVTKEGSTLEAFNSLKEEEGVSLLPTVEAATRACITQLQDYTLYTSKPIYNGYTVRAHLEKNLDEKARVDQQAVLTAINNGIDRETALAPFLTDEQFLDWYSSFVLEMDALMERD